MLSLCHKIMQYSKNKRKGWFTGNYCGAGGSRKIDEVLRNAARLNRLDVSMVSSIAVLENKLEKTTLMQAWHNR